MILAASANINRIEEECIHEAWADIQRLPNTWVKPNASLITPESTADSPAEFEGSAVEFGELDSDEPGDISPPNPVELEPVVSLSPETDTEALENDENWTVIEFGSLDDDESSLLDEAPGLDELAPVIHETETHLEHSLPDANLDDDCVTTDELKDQQVPLNSDEVVPSGETAGIETGFLPTEDETSVDEQFDLVNELIDLQNSHAIVDEVKIGDQFSDLAKFLTDEDAHESTQLDQAEVQKTISGEAQAHLESNVDEVQSEELMVFHEEGAQRHVIDEFVHESELTLQDVDEDIEDKPVCDRVSRLRNDVATDLDPSFESKLIESRSGELTVFDDEESQQSESAETAENIINERATLLEKHGYDLSIQFDHVAFENAENDAVQRGDSVETTFETDTNSEAELHQLRPVGESVSHSAEIVGDSEVCESEIDSGESFSNPFGEPFVEEEVVHDPYTQLVAEQNTDSLSITRDQLAVLDKDENSSEQSASSDEGEETRKEHEIQDEAPQDLDSVDATEPAKEQELLRTIQQQQDEIAEQIFQLKQNLVESNETMISNDALVASGIEATVANETSINNDSTPESLVMEYSLDQEPNKHLDGASSGMGDDRDILIVQRSGEHTAIPEPTAIESAQKSEVSTGRAIRMNYEDLFQQLRTVD